MRTESAEAVAVVVTVVPERTHGHCLQRVITAPTKKVRQVFLQLFSATLRGSKSGTQGLDRLPNGDLMLTEHHRGVMITARISMAERGWCSSEVRVQLDPHPPHDLPSIYSMGIDDLWEERLYIITDRVMRLPDAQVEQCAIAPSSETLRPT